MKNLQCKLTRKRWMEIGVSVLLFVLIIAWALVLEYTEPDREATAARKRFFAVARVTDILDDNAETQDWTEGRRIGQQYLEVEILNGPWKGETLEAINDLSEDCRRETDEIYFALSQLARKNCELQTRRIAGFRKTDKK